MVGIHIRCFAKIRFLFSLSARQTTHRAEGMGLKRGAILREQSERVAGTGPEIQYKT